ncbi:MAG: hypothetical protein KAR38_15015 [Calditrichia bacterium]|nr:hypothetical protein [Calditrichia bacterium]
MEKKNRIAQWAFDTTPILGRFHIWLEDVEVEWIRGTCSEELKDVISFVDGATERLFTMTAAVTALGTKLFGRYGEGKDLDKKGQNQAKKDADAVSAYIMSESLWYLSRSLPENHAIMVCLGEGLMPKGGESPDMGSNPMLGFGRIYARPQVAKFLDRHIYKLINNDDYTWNEFRRQVNHAGITIWGTAIDTLENTSRFAKGASTGPMTILHVFDQPLSIAQPYEGYIGNLVLPKEVIETAKKDSILIDFFTPRKKVLEAIQNTYKNIKPENLHVWTLQGKTREARIGNLWKEWKEIGAHIVQDDWKLPSGYNVFTDSGTYAPTYRIKTWKDDNNETHLLIVDGYAASAEAMQAASLSPILDLEASLAIFSSKYELEHDKEAEIMHLDPEDENFDEKLSDLFGTKLEKNKIEEYKDFIRQAQRAGIPLDKRTVSADDFLPEKEWRVMALSGFMLPDPYVGAPGVEKVSEDTYKVTVRLSTKKASKRTTFTLKLMESFEESRLVCNPLLNRFMHGENYRERPVKISDSGRIRNELQTLVSEALEHSGIDGIRVIFNKISKDVILPENQVKLKEILNWYIENHPLWFDWLEIVD